MTTASRLLGSARWYSGLLACVLALMCSLGHAAGPLVQVENAWVRPAVKGQSGTGGFMTLTSSEPLTLVGFKTPAAASAELHEMVMQGDVMRMRPIDALPLPAGTAVTLKAGGHHLMLMGLKGPLKAGHDVPLTLLLRDTKGGLIKQTVRVPVLASAPGASASGASHDDHAH